MNNQILSPTTLLHDLIAAHPFFTGINPHYVHLLADCASFIRVGMGQVIFCEGQDADHFYVIEKGRVALQTFVPRKGRTTVQTIDSGDALGWSWLFPPYQWHFTARAIEPCELIAFGAAGLREKAEENHDFGYDLVMRVSGIMLHRLQATRRRLVEFYTPD